MIKPSKVVRPLLHQPGDPAATKPPQAHDQSNAFPCPFQEQILAETLLEFF